MKVHLSDKKCVACEGGVLPLTSDETAPLVVQVPKWTITDNREWLQREFSFRNFKEALAFVNKVGELAESEGHHPSINLFDFSHVLISLSTHAIGGLSENDFILAAKTDKLT